MEKIATKEELKKIRRTCDFCGGFAFLRDYTGLKFCFKCWFSTVIHSEFSDFWGGLFFELKNGRIF